MDQRYQTEKHRFYLVGVRKTWFLNYETDTSDWNIFCTIFRDFFGRPAFGTTDALQELSYRVHHPEQN